jgi:hypothetical protein
MRATVITDDALNAKFLLNKQLNKSSDCVIGWRATLCTWIGLNLACSPCRFPSTHKMDTRDGALPVGINFV